MKHTLYLFLFLFTSTALHAQSGLTETIRQNYIRLIVPGPQEADLLTECLLSIPPESELSDQAVVELHQRYPLTREQITEYAQTILPDGSWPDINYADTKRSGWEPKKHAERILETAKYLYAHPEDQEIRTKAMPAIHTALAYWFREKPVCLNWWYNEIGLPKTFGPAFLILKDELSPGELQGAIEVMEQAKIGMTGQNKVWLAGNVLMRAILQENETLLREARQAILEEITTGAPEGIKSDWSFHQHGPQQQFGNYGLTYLTEMSFYSNLFAGTPLAMDRKQQQIINNLLLQGYRWVIWKGYMDINALDRQLFHNAPLHKALSTGFAARALIANSQQEDAKELQNYIEDNFDPSHSTSRFTGHKHFWESDQTVHRAPHWMTSVKMASNRIIGTELVNEDNLKGFYMADGATYIYQRGDEYLNIFPFWDWRKIPGITSYDSPEPIPTQYGPTSRNQTDFVGGITDGNSGMTAMILTRDGVHAKKAWVMTSDFVLCLGSDIRTDSCLQLTTSIDQRVRKGDLLEWSGGNWNPIHNMSISYPPASDQRYFHDNTGYILCRGSEVIAQSATRSGQWHDFMGMYTPAPVTGEIISLYIKHTSTPDTYQYLLLPASTPEQTAAFDPAQVRILRNDEKAQAVCYKDTWYITIYEPMELELAPNRKENFPATGIYMLLPDGEKKIQPLIP